MERALAQGIVIIFIHYPHEGNLLPTWLGPRSGDDEREPDVNILMSSTAPVTAGCVAMLKSVRPDLGPAELKRMLMETSREIVFEGHTSPRTVDIAAALERALTR